MHYTSQLANRQKTVQYVKDSPCIHFKSPFRKAERHTVSMRVLVLPAIVANIVQSSAVGIIAGSRPIGMAIVAYRATPLRADLRLLLQPSVHQTAALDSQHNNALYPPHPARTPTKRQLTPCCFSNSSRDPSTKQRVRLVSFVLGSQQTTLRKK